MAQASRQHAHELIDRMAPRQVSAVVNLLEIMLETELDRIQHDDPVSRAIANAPMDDEPETEAVAASKAWMEQHPGEGIPHEEILAEFGLSSDDLKR